MIRNPKSAPKCYMPIEARVSKLDPKDLNTECGPLLLKASSIARRGCSKCMLPPDICPVQPYTAGPNIQPWQGHQQGTKVSCLVQVKLCPTCCFEQICLPAYSDVWPLSLRSSLSSSRLLLKRRRPRAVEFTLRSPRSMTSSMYWNKVVLTGGHGAQLQPPRAWKQPTVAYPPCAYSPRQMTKVNHRPFPKLPQNSSRILRPVL